MSQYSYAAQIESRRGARPVFYHQPSDRCKDSPHTESSQLWGRFLNPVFK